MALTNADIIAFFGKIDDIGNGTVQDPEVKTVTPAHLTRLQTAVNRVEGIPDEPGATPDQFGLAVYRYWRGQILDGERSIAVDRLARPTEL